MGIYPSYDLGLSGPIEAADVNPLKERRAGFHSPRGAEWKTLEAVYLAVYPVFP